MNFETIFFFFFSSIALIFIGLVLIIIYSTNIFKNHLEFFFNWCKQVLIIYFFIFLILNRFNSILELKFSLMLLSMVSVFIVILFKSFLELISIQIKNSFIFNYIFFYYLNFTNIIYKIVASTFVALDGFKYRKLCYFQIIVYVSLYSIFFFKYMAINNQILLLILLLINSLLHNIQSQFVFNIESVQKDLFRKNFQLDYPYIQKILGVKNSSTFFEKKDKFVFLQKRYIMKTSIIKKVKENLVLAVSGIGVAGCIAGVVGYSEVKRNASELRKNNVIVDIEQKRFAFEQEQAAFEQELAKTKMKYENLDKIDSKIENYQKVMDTSSFWNRVDHSKQIAFLKTKREEVLKDFDNLNTGSGTVTSGNNSANSVLEDFFF